MNNPFAHFRRLAALLGVLVLIAAASGCNTQPPSRQAAVRP